MNILWLINQWLPETLQRKMNFHWLMSVFLENCNPLNIIYCTEQVSKIPANTARQIWHCTIYIFCRKHLQLFFLNRQYRTSVWRMALKYSCANMWPYLARFCRYVGLAFPLLIAKFKYLLKAYGFGEVTFQTSFCNQCHSRQDIGALGLCSLVVPSVSEQSKIWFLWTQTGLS